MTSIVVLGCGIGGVQLIRKLEKKLPSANVTIIEKRDSLVIKYATPRAIVYGNAFSHRAAAPNYKVSKNWQILHANAVSADEEKVVLDDGTEVRYDYLVCATGGHNVLEPPSEITSKEGMVDYWNTFSDKIRESKRILIIGGGPTSIELAGEVKDLYKNDKEITIVTNSDKLVANADPPLNKKFYKRLNKIVKKSGVEVVTKEAVDMNFDSDIPYLMNKSVTINGEEKNYDLVVRAVGYSLNSGIYPEEWKNERGALKVKPTLQLVDHSNIFALGDLTDLPEVKVGYVTIMHSAVIASNIVALIKSKKVLKSYKPAKSSSMLLPFGRRTGVTAVGPVVFGSKFTSLLKGKDLFVTKSWTDVRAKGELKKADI